MTYYNSETTNYQYRGTYRTIEINLSNKKILKTRQVYDIITFVAEISGFADLFIVFATFFLATFVQPQMLQAALLEHMRPFILKRNSNH
jgi:hypothetical protein